MIILTGVAGAGKSMQGQMLADEYGYAWISTGEILRVLVTGRRRHEMLQGKLLSDAEMIKVMDKVIELVDTTQEFVLDGFPRTVKQTEWVLKQVRAKRFTLTAVFHLQASEAVVRERLLNRGRPDDIDEAITKRFEEYKTVTLPIIDCFSKEGVPVYAIDAAPQPLEVHAAVMQSLRNSGLVVE